MKRKSVFILFFVCFFTNAFAQQVNGLIEFEDEQFKIVKVWGTHEERGYAVGYLLAEDIDDLFENYLLPAFGSYYSMARTLLTTDAHIRIDSIYIYEAMAMAEGINETGIMSMTVDHIDILLANSFLDFQNFLSKGLGLDNGCSSFINWGDATAGTDLDRKSIMSRHLDWDDQPVIVRNQVMVIHYPAEENEQPWLLIGFAGQMSVLSGLNQSGVAVMQHMLSDEYSSATINKSYEPIWFTMRKAIEMRDFNNDGVNNCLDINDAILQNTNGYADSYIVTGVAPSYHNDDNKIATIIEVAPAIPYITIRNTEYEDAVPNKNLYAANWTIARNDYLHFCSRYNGVKNNMGDGTNIGSAENWQIMLDYSSSCITGGFGNIQFMQFIPENNYLKLAYHRNGGIQACETEPLVFDTQQLFQIPTFVNNRTEPKKLKVHPNPSNVEIIVFVPNSADGDVLELYGSNGTLVLTITVIAGNNIIDISNFPKGVFLLKLKYSGLASKLVIN